MRERRSLPSTGSILTRGSIRTWHKWPWLNWTRSAYPSIFSTQATWFDKILRAKIEWDISAYGQGFAIDPSLGLTYFETNSATAPDGKSLGGYSNPEFDQWLQKAEIAMKEEDRTKAYREAEKILLKDAASIPLWAYRNLYAWNKKVKGLGFNDSGNIYVTTQNTGLKNGNRAVSQIPA
jgi:ABC-type oligopeptide transport system substrate-binding subunit